MVKSKKFNRYLNSELTISNTDEHVLSVNYEHYKEAEIKTVDFLVNSEAMTPEQKLEYLEAVKKTLDSNTAYAMYKLNKRQKAGEIKSTYEVETEADDEADSLFFA